MKRHLGKSIPALLCLVVTVVAGLLQFFLQTTDPPRWLLALEALEGMTYDWRVKRALSFPAPAATNLGVVSINEDSIASIRRATNLYGFKADIPWPRHVYGRLVQELDAQGAAAVGLDVLFGELRLADEPVTLPDGTVVTSDHFFALQMQSAGNVILAAQVSPNMDTVFPPPMFAVTAWAVGDITAPVDSDGVFRRVKAFQDYIVWDERILEARRTFDGFAFDTNRLSFLVPDGPAIQIPIAPDGTTEMARLFELGRGTNFPANTRRFEKAFLRYRAWNLGLTLAAHDLGLDLANASIEPGRRIVLRGPTGVERVLPIDHAGRLLIDWSLRETDPRLTHETIHGVLKSSWDRHQGKTNEIRELWRGKLALVGSLVSGNDLLDIGTTPLGPNTFLTSSLWNMANSLITGRFVTQSPLGLNLAVIALLGLVSAWITSKSRTLTAALIILLLGFAYVGIAVCAYIQWRSWMPLVTPLAALVFIHFALLTYRVVFEQKERRRIRGVFARMVSPDIVSELLKAEKLSFEGTRREVTVFFSDVRGFTALTDKSHARAEEHVRQHKLIGAEAEAYFDAQAKEVLATVNRYLSAIAEQVQVHEGTLDKYIGDCVMAFWGAPTPNLRHAVACVRAAMDAQRAIARLNEERAAENPLREQENSQRATRGEEPLPMLDPLFMGSGINTGIVNIGLMGSEKNSTYTVFGREVNLASRLEGLSGRGRIVISESTFRALQRDDPNLAAACRELPPADLKGFSAAVKVYEVPWKTVEGAPAFESEHVAAKTSPAAGCK